MKKILWYVILLNLVIGLAGAREVKAKVIEEEIIERLIRLEEGQKKLEEGQKYILREMDKRFEAVDKRFEAIDKRFEELVNILIAIIAAFASIVAITISFAIWDRKTALRPAIVKTTKLEEEFQKIVQILKQVAKKDMNVAEALRYVGLV